MGRWFLELLLVVAALVAWSAVSDRLELWPGWLLLVGSGALVFVVGRSPWIAADREVEVDDDPPVRPAPRKASSRDPALRPVSRLSGTDPLDPIFGAQASFPADPDQGRENAHHLVIDPHDLGDVGDPGADRVGSGREET